MRRPLDPCPDVDEVLRYNGVTAPDPPDEYADAIARLQAAADRHSRARANLWDERPIGKLVLRLLEIACVALVIWALFSTR